MRLREFFQLCEICILLHRCNLKIWAKKIGLKNQQFSWNFSKKVEMSQNLQSFVKFQKFQLENQVDFEKCCKTHIYTPPLGGQKTQAFWLAPQKNLLALMLVRHFQSRCGVPRCDDMRWWDDVRTSWWDDVMMTSSDDGGHFWAIFGPFFMDFRRKY